MKDNIINLGLDYKPTGALTNVGNIPAMDLSIYKTQSEMETVRILSIIASQRKFITRIADANSYGLGTALYRFTRIVPIYKFDLVTLQQYIPAYADIIGINLNISYGMGIVYPNFDLKRLGEEESAVIVSQLDTHMAHSIAWLLDFSLARTINEFVGALPTVQPAEPIPMLQQDYLVQFDSAGGTFIDTTATSTIINSNLQILVQAGIDIANHIDRNIFATDDRFESIKISIYNRCGGMLSGGSAKMTYAPKAFDYTTEGHIWTNIVGYGANEVPFYDKAYAQSADNAEGPFGSDTFDFTNLYGIMYHEDCFAQPFNLTETFNWRSTLALYPMRVTRFTFGMGILRPALFRLIVQKGMTTWIPGVSGAPGHWGPSTPEAQVIYNQQMARRRIRSVDELNQEKIVIQEVKVEADKEGGEALNNKNAQTSSPVSEDSPIIFTAPEKSTSSPTPKFKL